MVLFLDIRNDSAIVAIIEVQRARWMSMKGERVGFRLFDRVKKVLGKKKPEAVIVAVGEPSAKRALSWSTMRTGVAMANGLAFAWGIPLAPIEICGDETRGELAEMVKKAANKAKKNRWITTSYNGEPNITKAKNNL